MHKNTKKEIPRSMEATDVPTVLSNIDESWYNSVSNWNNIGIQPSNNRIGGKSYDLVGTNGCRWKLWSVFPVKYSMMQLCLALASWCTRQSVGI
jgi:hypothetical protein